MGLVLGIIVGLVTVAVTGITIFANMMSDAPGERDPWWQLLVCGTLVSALLIASHYVGW